MGEISNGIPNGFRVLTEIDESYCIGNFINGKAHGMLKVFDSHGKKIYDGEFIDGNQVEESIINNNLGFNELQENRNNEKYQQKNFAANKGVITLPDGSRYEGDIIDDLANGEGISYETDGSRYEGQFKDGLFHGTGTFTRPNKDIEHGLWKNGMMEEGYIRIYSSGDLYEGQWKNGRLNGRGKIVLINSDITSSNRDAVIYEGTFEDGKLDGFIVTTRYNNGYNTSYVSEGTYNKGKKHGDFVIIREHDISVEIYNNDKLVREYKL